MNFLFILKSYTANQQKIEFTTMYTSAAIFNYSRTDKICYMIYLGKSHFSGNIRILGQERVPFRYGLFFT